VWGRRLTVPSNPQSTEEWAKELSERTVRRWQTQPDAVVIVAEALHNLDAHHPGYSEKDRAEAIVSALVAMCVSGRRLP
jgi:hypothetical protein